jgi:hypothetical protein
MGNATVTFNISDSDGEVLPGVTLTLVNESEKKIHQHKCV